MSESNFDQSNLEEELVLELTDVSNETSFNELTWASGQSSEESEQEEDALL